MKKKIAVIGCGYWGKNILRNFCQILSPDQVICCDQSLEIRQLANSTYPGIKSISDVEQVWDDSEVAAAVIATPAPTHSSLALEAIRAGKDVLIEKPMALTIDDGKEMISAARKHDRILMVGHLLEYHPAIQKLKDLIADGAFGRLRHIYSNRLNFGRIRVEENALWSFAPHDIAIILRLTDSMPDTVATHGGAFLNQDIADFAVTNLTFPEGIAAHIFVSWLHPYKDHRLVVIGERLMAVLDDSLPWDEKLTLFPHSVDWVGGNVPVAQKAEAQTVQLEETEPLKAECEHFINCIETRQEPLTSGNRGLQVLRVLDAAQKSLSGGGSVPMASSIVSNPLGKYEAHPTAAIDENVKIGSDTRIWHHSHVMSGARIGNDCVLGQNVFVGKNVKIGNGVKIQNNVSVYEGVELEDFVFCGPSAVFTNVFNPRSEVERKDQFKKTIVKTGASLGAGSIIVCGVTIGNYSFVGAGATVTRNVPDYALVYGNPAKVKGWMCKCGEKLTLGLDETNKETICKNCKTRYQKTNQTLTKI